MSAHMAACTGAQRDANARIAELLRQLQQQQQQRVEQALPCPPSPPQVVAPAPAPAPAVSPDRRAELAALSAHAESLEQQVAQLQAYIIPISALSQPSLIPISSLCNAPPIPI